jgi:hypothetical protein
MGILPDVGQTVQGWLALRRFFPRARQRGIAIAMATDSWWPMQPVPPSALA